MFDACLIRGPYNNMNRLLPIHQSLAATLIMTLSCVASLYGQDNLAGLEEEAMRAAALRVAPSVVRVETSSHACPAMARRRCC